MAKLGNFILFYLITQCWDWEEPQLAPLTHLTIKEGAEEACLSMITSGLLAFPVLIVISDANVREGKA